MIKFSCKSCGQKLSVKEEHSGKRIKCPKCGGVSVVPDASDPIQFHCENCGQSIRVPQIHAGKKGKCPKCKNPIVVPSLKKEPAGLPVSGPPIPPDTDEDVYEDESDLPEEGRSLDRRLILIICGAAAVVIAGLIILITVILPSGSEPVERPDMSMQQRIPDADSQSQPVASNNEPAGTLTNEPAKEKVTPEEPVRTPVAASDEAGKLDLKLRLKPGQKHNLQIINECLESQTIRGRQNDRNYINTIGLEFNVEHVDANDDASLKVTYLKIHEITKTPAGQEEYDSTKPDTAMSYRNFGPRFTAMIGQSFIAKVTPEGDIVELEGLTDMYSQMAERVVVYEDEAIRQRYAKMPTNESDAVAKRQIDKRNQKYGSREKRIEATKERLGNSGHTREQYIRDMLVNMIMSFPGGPVGIGDSWPARTALFSLGDVGLDHCTYTLRETTPTAVSVDFSSKIELDNEPDFSESLKVTMKGSCEGSLDIDPSSGWMLRKKMTMHCSGEMKISPTEQTPQGMTIPISLEITTTVKPLMED